jgi:hypothetical protein
MKTTIFVPVLTSDAKWIFCNQETAFDLGIIHAEGKILTGYHTAEEAVQAYEEKQPQEPFAILHLIVERDMHDSLAYSGALVGTGSDSRGRRLWTLNQEGCNFLFSQGKYQLLMEIIPVKQSGICLY